jgi:hypothetical protein
MTTASIHALHPLFVCTLVGTLAACGGSDSGSPTPAPIPAPAPAPTPPPAGPAQHQQVVLLAESALAFQDMASASTFFATDDEVKVLASAQTCSAGSASSSLDGAAVATGTQLPTGNHVFATVFSGCTVLTGATLTGTSNMSYSAPTSILTGVTATSTASALRAVGVTGAGAASDLNGAGSGAFSYSEITAGNQLTVTSTFAPAGGATLMNNLTGRVLTFNGGEVEQVYVLEGNNLRRFDLEYRGLTFVVPGAAYVIDGKLIKNFDANGQFTSTAGEATLKVAGTTVARVFFVGNSAMNSEVMGSLAAW